MINKRTIIATLLCTSLAATAKADFYLKPTVGVGLGSATSSGLLVPLRNTGFKSCYMGQVIVGYRLAGLRLETGLGYMTSGFTEKDLLFLMQNNTMYKGELRYVYSHLIVPVRATYKIGLGNRLSIVPHAGADVSYNLGTKSKIVSDNPGFSTDYVKGRDFSNIYRRISLWANGGLDVEVRVANHLSVVAGPKFRYMVTSILKDKTTFYDPRLRNYVISLEAGVLLSL